MKTEPCPSCGKPMERGFLVAESLIGGAKWVEKKTRLAIRGSPVASADRWGNVYLSGFRCPDCHRLLLAY
ncbi:MAG: hypothetical protein HY557_02280 [Euryarchaeota archaeon]|nr:hypothetical protein [Euryarchaeota archaeon]